MVGWAWRAAETAKAEPLGAGCTSRGRARREAKLVGKNIASKVGRPGWSCAVAAAWCTPKATMGRPCPP
eukprot:8667840-Pyramimonas_sp.AAC.1